MQKILGYLRKAVQRYDMLSDDDRVCVGVSGGKDSVVLLYGLTLMKRFIGIDYQVVGLTLDPNFGGVQTDYSPVADFCATHDIEYHVVQTQIGEKIHDESFNSVVVVMSERNLIAAKFHGVIV